MSSFEVKIRFVRNVDGWRRGDTVTVTRDAYVDRLVENGFVVVVSDSTPEVPARNASTAEWMEFMKSRGFSVHPQMTRRILMDIWDGVDSRG